MDTTELVTARGVGAWGPNRYEVELTQRSSTWHEQETDATDTVTTWHVICTPRAGGQAFASPEDRAAFLSQSFGDELDLTSRPARATGRAPPA
jgi:hypothetical protein